MSGFRIGMSGLEDSPSAKEQRRLRARFDRTGCVKLPAFLSSSLLRRLRDGLKDARYITVKRSSGPERAIVEHWTLDLLTFLLNDPAVLSAMTGIIGGPIGVCTSRKLYRLDGGVPGRKGWHRDSAPGRRAVLSVNLSERRHRGGDIESRLVMSPLRLDAVHTDPGDAALITADPRFAHRVTDVKGRGRRVAFAIGFHAGVSYRRLALASGATPSVRFRNDHQRRLCLDRGLGQWRDGRKLMVFLPPNDLREVDESRERFRALTVPKMFVDVPIVRARATRRG
jgi:hypothetical protein